MLEDTLQKRATQIGLHSVKNMLGSPRPLAMDHEKLAVAVSDLDLNIVVGERFERFGIDLSDIQSRVLEGILSGFTQTGYLGNMNAKPTEEVVQQKNYKTAPLTYKYIEKIPQLRATQNEILEWSGINKSSIATRIRAIEALNELSTKQYCFFYDRLAYDENKVPIRDRKGNWVKEDVAAVDSLFTIKAVKDPIRDRIKYYEIMLSPLFLDQRDSYFMLVPNNWREEVQALYGKKKASACTFRFLMMLRYQYEVKRRSRHVKPPYIIKWKAEDVARAIRISDHTIARNRKRMNMLLEDAYSTAQSLGYLTGYLRHESIDELSLNEEKYYDPSLLPTPKEEKGDILGPRDLEKAEKLLEYFNACRKSIDPHYQSSPKTKNKDLNCFKKLLDSRSEDEVKSVLQWSLEDSYWCSRLSSPPRILSNYDQAIAVLNVKKNTANRPLANRKVAEDVLSCVEPTLPHVRMEIFNECVEIGHGGAGQPERIDYTNPDFEQTLQATLRRWKFRLKQN